MLFENDEEAAFSNYVLWESVGFILVFILQTQVCIEVKLYIVSGVIVAAMAGYFLLEIIEMRKKR